MPVGAGIAVAGVASGVASSRAAKSAAEAGAEGAALSGAQIQAGADRARGDVLNFFPAAQQNLLSGAGAAGDLLASGIGEQQRLLSAGNVGAQGTLQGGFGQVQNALLGLPVNQQAFAPKPIELSQIPQNPLVQQAGQQALAGQPAQQPQGLFQNIADVQPAAQQEAFSGLKTNLDLFNAVSSGRLVLPNISPADAAFFGELADEGAGGLRNASNDILTASPDKIREMIETSTLTPQNKRRLENLLKDVADLRRGQQ